MWNNQHKDSFYKYLGDIFSEHLDYEQNAAVSSKAKVSCSTPVTRKQNIT